ncbi:MAG: hypothetical protein AAGK32_19310, partial [Actinomycetota bacterium]
NGPGDDAGPIRIVDEIVRPLEFVSAEGAGWSCQYANRLLTCDWSSSLAAGTRAEPVHIRTKVTNPTPGDEITNGVSVVGTGTESSAGNNSGSDGVLVTGAGSASQGDGGLLPRTGADIEELVLLGLALVLGGRRLTRRQDG